MFVECLSEPRWEAGGICGSGGRAGWLIPTAPTQGSANPLPFSYFANLSAANLLLTSCRLSSPLCQHGCPEGLSQQSHNLSVGDITGWHKEAGGE